MDSETPDIRPHGTPLRRQRQFLAAIWLGVMLQIAGQAIDFHWHATHREFEAPSDQLQAHWLVWLGSLVTLIAAGLAIRALARGSNGGLVLTVAAGVGYVAVSIWHFLEHAAGADPAAPHVLLAVTKVATLAGVIWATVQWRAYDRASSP
jgi:FtsH-binding integral membrane protein